MPLERPQLLDAYFSEREVEESNIDRSLVAGKAKTLYFRPARTPIGYIRHILRRRVGRQRLPSIVQQPENSGIRAVRPLPTLIVRQSQLTGSPLEG